MKIVVTGASGFVGRYVAAELARHSVETTVVSRDAHRLADWSNTFGIVEMDLDDTDPGSFDLLGRPDVLVHLAWDGLPNYRSLHHFESELPRQFRFLKTLVEAGLPSLVVAGSCFEYGMQSGPLTEGMITQPVNPYGHAKDALRRELEFLRLANPFSLTWARLFYMYGEGQSPNSLYAQIAQAVLRGERRFNMSGGEQLRDYLPVAEVARLIVALVRQRCDLGVVNVCAGKPISVRSLVEGWLAEKGWNIELNLGHYPYSDDEPMAFWGNAERLLHHLSRHDCKSPD